MKKTSLIILILLAAACGKAKKPVSKLHEGQAVRADSTVAIKFLNEYLSSYQLSPEDYQKWLKEITTEKFFSEYNKITADELDFDPILEAQDAPSEFELESLDPETGYVIAQGVGREDFRVLVRIAQENGQWLVDGSGMVNIPGDERLEKE